MKKGLTLVELLVSMVIFSIILAATSNIFIVALKNYQVSMAKSSLQNEVNFLLDDIANNAKLATEIPASYDIYNRPESQLILAVPAIDASRNFLYSGSNLLKDYYVYYLDNGSLHKKIFSNNEASIRFSENGIDSVVLTGVETTSPFTYPPGQSSVQINFSAIKTVKNIKIKVVESRLVNLRNKQ
jgi:prepilin-type N-terminal cleavage/methylation domain-containing protein